MRKLVSEKKMECENAIWELARTMARVCECSGLIGTESLLFCFLICDHCKVTALRFSYAMDIDRFLQSIRLCSGRTRRALNSGTGKDYDAVMRMLSGSEGYSVVANKKNFGQAPLIYLRHRADIFDRALQVGWVI